MRKIAIVLACIALAGHGRRARITSTEMQGNVASRSRSWKQLQSSGSIRQSAVSHSLKALEQLLTTLGPAAGWQIASARSMQPVTLRHSGSRAAMLPRFGKVSMSATTSAPPTTAPPSQEVWNDQIKEAWTRAYASASEEPVEYEITQIDGTIPHDLRGTIFRNGPGNFERGGERYQHVLDGDGLLSKFSIDGSQGRARYTSRFVATPEYVEERTANEIKHRNTFGTQPSGFLANLFKVTLKNPANTNIQFSWGGKCLALWEAALPCRIDPATLSYVGVETFDGLLADGGLTVTSGMSSDVDRSLGLGVAFTAHPREDRKRGRMVGWTWAAPLIGEELSITIYEWDDATGEVLHSTPATLSSPVAPHDFAITDNFYIFALNAMELKLAPFLLGLTGPVGALRTTGEGVILALLPRPGGSHAGSKPLTIQTNDPYFAIHHAVAFEEPLETPDGSPVLRLYTAAWPRVGQGPFLGDWGGAVPLYDDGRINPTLMLESTIRLSDTGASVERAYVSDGACIDHPHIDPRFEGDPRVRYIYMSYCNAEGVSGSPPLGWARWDRQTGKMAIWRAPPRTFCEELVVIPRPGGTPEEDDKADVWLAGMMFDAESGRSSLAILDGDNIEAGPVCRLWLNSHTPHGLHGVYTRELFDAF